MGEINAKLARFEKQTGEPKAREFGVLLKTDPTSALQ